MNPFKHSKEDRTKQKYLKTGNNTILSRKIMYCVTIAELGSVFS